MRASLLCRLSLWLFCAGAGVASAAPEVTSFSPTGSVKGVRQVQVRFGEPMVAFGDPRAPTPFGIDCPVGGTARWVDTRHWTFDFERDLPGGVTRLVLRRKG